MSDYGEPMKLVEGTPYEEVVKPLLVGSKAVSAVFCPSERNTLRASSFYLLRRQDAYLGYYQEFFLLLGLMAACVFPPLPVDQNFC